MNSSSTKNIYGNKIPCIYNNTSNININSTSPIKVRKKLISVIKVNSLESFRLFQKSNRSKKKKNKKKRNKYKLSFVYFKEFN